MRSRRPGAAVTRAIAARSSPSEHRLLVPLPAPAAPADDAAVEHVPARPRFEGGGAAVRQVRVLVAYHDRPPVARLDLVAAVEVEREVHASRVGDGRVAREPEYAGRRAEEEPG